MRKLGRSHGPHSRGSKSQVEGPFAEPQGATARALCGPPTASTVIKLKDWEEGMYKISDANRPDIGMPRGEVLIGGPMVRRMGYP